MNISSAREYIAPSIKQLKIAHDILEVRLYDGRIIFVPIAWFPSLANATIKQLKNFEISPSGYGIHWPDLDEDLSVEGFLFNPSILKLGEQ